ncbi:MAG: type II toxin-antitoxin system HicB family antitoxin [Dehalococcoidia bacterium]|jgi:predicted RNase H-like HicB family nuclease
MVKSYTAKYTKISSGYMGQLVEWPEVITEGKDIDECREMLKDALTEMILVVQTGWPKSQILIPLRQRFC